MKKLLICFVLAAVVLISCDPFYDVWAWRINNNTDQTIKFNFITQRHPDSPAYGLYQAVTIPPGGTYSIHGTETRTYGRDYIVFSYLFSNSANLYGEDVYWQILSEDDIVLKTWKYSDMDVPDQRFFKESLWNYEKVPSEDNFVKIVHLWTFDILPEDIQP